VIETFRGAGVFQEAVDIAIQKLNEGAWVHLFGEGKVNQPGNPTLQDPESQAQMRKEVRLFRFKWGVGRILMEVENPPIIIPMWLTGFDQLMPEGRRAPFKFFPRRGANLSITFGKPIHTDDIKVLLDSVTPNRPSEVDGDTAILHNTSARKFPHSPDLNPQANMKGKVAAEEGWIGDQLGPSGKEQHICGPTQIVKLTENERIRSAVTAILQRHVEDLGREVHFRQSEDRL